MLVRFIAVSTFLLVVCGGSAGAQVRLGVGLGFLTKELSARVCLIYACKKLAEHHHQLIAQMARV